jgi:hypothetical protein
MRVFHAADSTLFALHTAMTNWYKPAMKRTLPVLFVLISVFCAPGDPPCMTTPCTEDINEIGDCPDDGCTRTEGHQFDSELDKRKNIRSDDQQPLLRTIRWGKGLPDPTNLTECGNRDELKQSGEGQKITVAAWALTAKKQGAESCNCDLSHEADVDNHIVLVDPAVQNPTLATDECRSVTAEFTPRVRLDHPNFTRRKLNQLIDANWKSSQKVANGKLLVRVTGLLMFDSKHFFHSQPPVVRDSNWEIHPVLKFEYCPNDKTCRADSDENWVDFDNL